MSNRLLNRALSLTQVAALSAFALGTACLRIHAQQQGQISSYERGLVEDMLWKVHHALKTNYYDPSFHGLDIDARYKIYLEQVKNAPILAAAYRVVEAYLVGLDDSHTVFMPPVNIDHISYGYRMQMIGDACFITDVRPGTDAATKLHPGDQVLSLNGYAVNRKDLWQLDFYLNRISPKKTTELRLRDTAGNTRQESVLTEFEAGQRLHYLSNSRARMELEEWRHRFRSRFSEEGEVLFWKLPRFTGDEGDMSRMLGLARKHRALVLDLRGNPGGVQDALTFMLGSLFDHEVTIGKEVRRKGEKTLVAKSHGNSIFTGQLTVLVDSRSSSAAEIFARVVQIEHRGLVLGDRSAGSVMEATHYPLKEGVGVIVPYGASITTADLIMSDGQRLEKVGVTPDIVFLPTAPDLAAGRDPLLARAAELSGVKLDPEAAGKIFPFEWAPN